MPNKDNVLASLKSIKNDISTKYHISSLALFGSVARNEAKIDSDIDIAIETPICDYFSLYDLKEDLEKELGAKVDLVRIRERMNPYLKNRIAKDAIYV